MPYSDPNVGRIRKYAFEVCLGWLRYCRHPGFPPRGTGGDHGPPQYFSQKNPDFYRGLGGSMDPPKKNGVLEVVDDPPWSCDPTVQSIWLAVSKEVEEKGGKI